MDIVIDPAPSQMKALLDGVAAGDRAAFTRLVEAFDQDLIRFAYIVAADRGLAEDAAQAAWERLWHKPPTLRDPGKLKSWLLTVTANEARQAGRRQRRGVALELEIAATSSGADLESSAGLVDLGVALAKVSVEDRELLALRFVVEMPSAQIAAHLGVSPEGARTRVHRLLHRIREDMSHE